MKQLVCEVCGSPEMLKQEGVFVCQSCGCKYSLEEARKMFVEGKVSIEGSVDVSGSKVKIDKSDEFNNLLLLARRAKENGNFDDANKFYERILISDPNNWEANFYHIILDAINKFRSYDVNSVDTLFKSFSNNIGGIVGIVKITTTGEEQKKILSQICTEYSGVCVKIFNNVQKLYEGYDEETKKKMKNDIVTMGVVIRNFVLEAGDLFQNEFSNMLRDDVLMLWKKGMQMNAVLQDCMGVFCRNVNNDNMSTVYDGKKKYTKKIKEIETSYRYPEPSLFSKATRVM